MPIYTVQMLFRGNQKFNVEARDDEHAEELGIEMLQEACNGIPVEVYDAVVTMPSNQYTDQQELEDRERDHDRRT